MCHNKTSKCKHSPDLRHLGRSQTARLLLEKGRKCVCICFELLGFCCLFKGASLVCFMGSATVNSPSAIHVLRQLKVSSGKGGMFLLGSITAAFSIKEQLRKWHYQFQKQPRNYWNQWIPISLQSFVFFELSWFLLAVYIIVGVQRESNKERRNGSSGPTLLSCVWRNGETFFILKPTYVSSLEFFFLFFFNNKEEHKPLC